MKSQPQNSENCKFRNFRENFVFENRVTGHICHIKNSRLGYNLPTSVNYRVISSFRKCFIFTKLSICEVS